MRRERYCYWSLAVGTQRSQMERCARSARESGVRRSFHVLTDEPIAGCESYDRMSLPEQDGFEPLIYLRAGISKLLFDYFVWIDPSTLFTSNPGDLLGALGRSPLHVPLEADLSRARGDAPVNGLPAPEYARVLAAHGVMGRAYTSGSAFWIIRNEAIDHVCGLIAEIHHADKSLSFATALGYAMHMVCADPEAHHFARRPDLWAADHTGGLTREGLQGGPWHHNCPWTGETRRIQPSIVHQPVSDSTTVPATRAQPQFQKEETQ